ncbi:MAG: tetratricopeptide repeat protein [Chlorobi bacterium]|nr:tetratricopeptide repeat protein [Chlorobiota bacterium]
MVYSLSLPVMKKKLNNIIFFLFVFIVFPAFPQDEIDSIKQLIEKAEPAEQMKLYNEIGKLQYRKGKYPDALVNFKKSLQVAHSINDSLQIAKMYSNIGVINDVIGKYSVAIDNYQQSLKIYEYLNNKEGKESVLNNIGIVYEEMDMPDKALDFYFQALKLKKERGDQKSIAGTYNNIAIIFGSVYKNSDSAYYYYDQAMKIYQKTGDEKDVGMIYSNLGLIHLRKGEIKKAKDFFEKALKIFKKTEDPKNIASALYYLGLAHQGESDYTTALKYYLQAEKISEQHNIKKLQSQVCNDMARLYEDIHDYKNALTCFKKYDEIRNQLLNLEKIKKIHQLETNFELEKREHEIEMLKKQSELNELKLTWTKTVSIALITIFVLTIIIIVLISLKNRYKKEQEVITLQSRLFRSQTSPHFVFNSLMSIQTFLLENNVEKASEYLVDFAKLIRSILQQTRKSFITLDKEIEVLQQYVKLEKLRFSDKFDYSFEVNVQHPEEILFPPMLAQPFIENAIKHGLVPASKKGLLKILFEEKDNELTVMIEDNGIGRERSAKLNKNETHKSLATEITQERLQLMARRYKIKISMEIEDLYDDNREPAGTRVTFKMILN